MGKHTRACLHVRRKHKHKHKPRVNRDDASLRVQTDLPPCFTPPEKKKKKKRRQIRLTGLAGWDDASARKRNAFLFLVLALVVLASSGFTRDLRLLRTCKPAFKVVLH